MTATETDSPPQEVETPVEVRLFARDFDAVANNIVEAQEQYQKLGDTRGQKVQLVKSAMRNTLLCLQQ